MITKSENIIKRRIAGILFVLCVAGSTLWAQSRIIKGEVLDPNKEPLIGVGVVIKNTTIGTITDVTENILFRFLIICSSFLFLYRL